MMMAREAFVPHEVVDKIMYKAKRMYSLGAVAVCIGNVQLTFCFLLLQLPHA